MVQTINPQAQTLPVIQSDLLREIDGVMTLNFGQVVLVASESQKGMFHTTIPTTGECSCLGNTHHGHCRHTGIAARAIEMDRQTAEPVCETCGHPWNVKIAGHHFCGRCAPLPGSPEKRALDEESMERAMAYDPEWQAKYGRALND